MGWVVRDGLLEDMGPGIWMEFGEQRGSPAAKGSHPLGLVLGTGYVFGKALARKSWMVT